ncbi:hypothetical protein M8542_49190 [Amycolatopsis sp. OK19-0408]|uniref:Excreted virulence factor EspC (Type VII ESX diderm) n=1 Tax=Amycolatopsis iheyensis TaxID=2945988 RepID=A0A9X2SQ19_9PSEU|nr:hypothetical protein [Amycolatopsis iheyensis]MCR6490792.1 hypothetical protein [Amycolatopsis iheyensis]
MLRRGPRIRGDAISTDFTADPAAIAKLGALAGRAGHAAGLYAAQATIGPSEWGEGLLNLLAKPLDQWQALFATNTAKAQTLANAYDTSLVAVAKLYRETDHEAAAKADRSYPEAHSERVEADDVASPETAAAFTDFDNAALNPRTGEEYPGSLVPGEDALGGWNIEVQKIADKIFGGAAISGPVRGLLTKIAGTDLLTDLEKFVAGDWDGLLQQGMVFEDTGLAFGKIKQNIDRGRLGIQDRWTGHAGEAARAWLTDYSYACAAHAKFCTEAGWKIKNFARAAYDGMQVLDLALESLLDAVLGKVLKLGKALEGALLGIVGLSEGESLRTAIAGIMSELTPLRNAVDALTTLAHSVAGISELVAGNGEIAVQTWPGEPYKHPGT